jgi:hypothetical protein
VGISGTKVRVRDVKKPLTISGKGLRIITEKSYGLGLAVANSLISSESAIAQAGSATIEISIKNVPY